MIEITAKMVLNGKTVQANLNEPIDISLELNQKRNVRAWYVGLPEITPVEGDGFVGSVQRGGSVNFRNVFFNPHGHGTHTECAGHITKEIHSVNNSVKRFFSIAMLVTLKPDSLVDDERWMKTGDLVISKNQILELNIPEYCEALIIRTPNFDGKLTYNYSDSNPAYIHPKAMELISKTSVKHLLLDLPSVDREHDNGELLAHKLFWNVPEKPNLSKTITELIFVRDSVSDGEYLLELQVAPFNNDASPSRPVLYSLK